MLGRYALYQKIASGGMASVHLGRLLGPVGFARTVAIKRMHPQLATDPEFVSMFLDEARLAARIRHPNVVPTLDVVAMEEELFLVMELVQGESLARLIRAASQRGEHIPTEMIAAIMVGALHGLHAAHEARSDGGEPLGIVHRDVSPHNILVGTDGVARVLDFGVAKAAGRLQTTREGQLKGKLGYMAPEQIRGEVTRATDVYAASVVLWEALTSKRLFKGDNEAQVLDLVLRGCDVPPSRYAPGLPSALDEVTMRGLSVDPARRFSTAREMARALEDAIPLATASRIGDWVEVTAKDTLDERSARIASIESDSSLQAPPRAPSITGVTSTPAGDDLVPTQLSSGSVSSPAQSLPSGTRRRTSWLVAMGVAVVVVGAVVATMPRRSTATSAPASAPPVTTSAPPPSTSSTVAATASPAPSESAAPAVSASSPAASSTPVPPPPRTGQPRLPAATTPASTKPSCNPPWYFDSRGVRVFKPECL
jgi:serine/threonine-protein kinase